LHSRCGSPQSSGFEPGALLLGQPSTPHPQRLSLRDLLLPSRFRCMARPFGCIRQTLSPDDKRDAAFTAHHRIVSSDSHDLHRAVLVAANRRLTELHKMAAGAGFAPACVLPQPRISNAVPYWTRPTCHNVEHEMAEGAGIAPARVLPRHRFSRPFRCCSGNPPLPAGVFRPDLAVVQTAGENQRSSMPPGVGTYFTSSPTPGVALVMSGAATVSDSSVMSVTGIPTCPDVGSAMT
jgi:hypothetical protein